MNVIGFNGKYINNFYDLRWCLDFSSKNSKNGIWNNAGQHNSKSDSAWLQNKNGLIRARIEAKNRMTRLIHTVADCFRDDFITFRWVGATSLPLKTDGLLFRGKQLSKMKFSPSVHGITIVARDYKVTAYINGTIDMQPNNEKTIYLKEWSV